MADYTHTDLQLQGRHVPDPMQNAAGNTVSPQELGYDTVSPVTGLYEIGVEIDGAFVPIFVEKASLIFDRIDAAKQQAQLDQQQAQAQTQQADTQAQTPNAPATTPGEGQPGDTSPSTGPQAPSNAPQSGDPNQPQG